MGVEPKIGGLKTPKMDGENVKIRGKAYEQMDDLGGFPIVLETTMVDS